MLHVYIYIWAVIVTHFYYPVCEDPTPANGTVYKPDGFSFGASVSVDCDTGYVLFGDGLIKCQHGPVWSDHPVCTRGIAFHIRCYVF